MLATATFRMPVAPDLPERPECGTHSAADDPLEALGHFSAAGQAAMRGGQASQPKKRAGDCEPARLFAVIWLLALAAACAEIGTGR